MVVLVILGEQLSLLAVRLTIGLVIIASIGSSFLRLKKPSRGGW